MIGIFGGSFDPVHIGHLRLAMDIQAELELSELRLIPARRPPHREALIAAPEHRLAMLELAIAGLSSFMIDQRELAADGPRFTVDTLASIRKETDDSLVLLLGGDSFASLASWRHWEQLFELAHIAVMMRPGIALPDSGSVFEKLTSHRAQEQHELHECPSGKIFLSQSSLLDISSTRVRAMLAAGKTPRYLLPDQVLEYLVENCLYLS